MNEYTDCGEIVGRLVDNQV